MMQVWSTIPGAVELGLLYSLMALGVYITFRILDFPDLTVDGSFTTGGAIAAIMITNGSSPWLATIAAFAGGAVAGICTGLLHTKGKINGLLSGILMMTALYSINLRIMDKPNISLLRIETVFTALPVFVLMPIIVIAVKLLLDLFFRTDIGLSIRATGDNERMIRSFGANTDNAKIIGISLSNALVALSGALVAQYSANTDVNVGVGMIVIGLASVIVGEAIFGAKSIFRATLAVALGAIIYRIIIAIALSIPWMESSDLKLITAIIVIIAFVSPTAQRMWKQKAMARRRTRELLENGGGK